MVYKFLFSRKAPAPIKAAFLDRDGVINIDYAYVSKKEHFDFVEGALEGIRVLVEKGYAPVLITNQSGIGRGKYTVFEFKKLCCWLEGVLAKQNTPLLAVYFCPHHPEKAFAPYLQECSCRKSAPGMLLAAQEDLNINMTQSIFIGDKNSDMTAAMRADIPTRILVQSDGFKPFDKQDCCTQTAKNLLEAAEQL